MGRGEFDRGRPRARGCEALAEGVVQVPRERLPLLFLHRDEPLHQLRARGLGADETVGEIIAGAGDPVELGGCEARQRRPGAGRVDVRQPVHDLPGRRDEARDGEPVEKQCRRRQSEREPAGEANPLPDTGRRGGRVGPGRDAADRALPIDDGADRRLERGVRRERRPKPRGRGIEAVPVAADPPGRFDAELDVGADPRKEREDRRCGLRRRGGHRDRAGAAEARLTRELRGDPVRRDRGLPPQARLCRAAGPGDGAGQAQDGDREEA